MIWVFYLIYNIYVNNLSYIEKISEIFDNIVI